MCSYAVLWLRPGVLSVWKGKGMEGGLRLRVGQSQSASSWVVGQRSDLQQPAKQSSLG